MCIWDLQGVPCDQHCTHPSPYESFEVISRLFQPKMPVPMGLRDMPSIESTIAREEVAINALRESQKLLESKLQTMETDLKVIRAYHTPNRVISQEAVIRNLYPDIDFKGELRLISVLPKVLLRYKTYKLDLEIPTLCTNNRLKCELQVFSSKLPVTALQVPFTYRVSERRGTGAGEVVELQVQFQFTTKKLDFSNCCLLIASAGLKPVVLEGLYIRARKAKS